MSDALAHLVWREPLWLWLACWPWFVWGLRAVLERPGRAEYADRALLPWARARAPHRAEPWRLWRHAAMAFAWLLFAMALAGPRVAEGRYGQDAAQVPQVMVVLDVSRSMTAHDVAPSRLERARLELHDFIARADGLRIGLVVYAGRPHLMVPPTDDKRALRFYLDAVRYGVLPTAGSNLPDALAFAAARLAPTAAPRALLLVSDGETPRADAALEGAVAELRKRGIHVYALGVGTEAGAALPAAQGGWLREGGQPLLVKLHARRLQRLAALGNGRYAAVADSDADWQRLYDGGLRHLTTARRGAGDSGLTVWRELNGWFLLPALALLLLAHTAPPRRIPAAPLAALMVLAAATSGLLAPTPAHAQSGSLQARAYTAFAGKSFGEARRLYGRVAGYPGRMGEGSSAYRLGDYRAAVQLFTQAVLDADDDAQRADALLNLADSHYRLEDYDTAAQIYRDVLRYRPQDRAAQVNLGYAVAMLERRQRRARESSSGPARQGRGPRTASPSEGTEVTSGRLRLSEKPAVPYGTNGAHAASGPAREGIDSSRPAVADAREFADAQWQYADTSLASMIRRANAIQVDEAVLWKRIFEAEEGFPAPLSEPQSLPGMPPW